MEMLQFKPGDVLRCMYDAKRHGDDEKLLERGREYKVSVAHVMTVELDGLPGTWGPDRFVLVKEDGDADDD